MLTTRQVVVLTGLYLVSVVAAFGLGGGLRVMQEVYGVNRGLAREAGELADLKRRVLELKATCFGETRRTEGEI